MTKDIHDQGGYTYMIKDIHDERHTWPKTYMIKDIYMTKDIHDQINIYMTKDIHDQRYSWPKKFILNKDSDKNIYKCSDHTPLK